MNSFKFQNRVRLSGIDLTGKAWEQIAFNTLTHAASDILMAALLQSGPSKVTHLYLQHGGSTNTAPPNLPVDLGTMTQALFMATVNGYDNGGLWIPIVAPPEVSSSAPTLYEANLANWYIPIPGSPPAAQYTGNFVPGTSQILTLGLAVAQNVNDRSQDVVISVLPAPGEFTAFVVPSNGQSLVNYPLQITT